MPYPYQIAQNLAVQSAHLFHLVFKPADLIGQTFALCSRGRRVVAMDERILVPPLCTGRALSCFCAAVHAAAGAPAHGG